MSIEHRPKVLPEIIDNCDMHIAQWSEIEDFVARILAKRPREEHRDEQLQVANTRMKRTKDKAPNK